MLASSLAAHLYIWDCLIFLVIIFHLRGFMVFVNIVFCEKLKCTNHILNVRWNAEMMNWAMLTAEVHCSQVESDAVKQYPGLI